MAFVKLDTGILDSTLWIERECREVFITALLLATPNETLIPLPQYEVRSLKQTGFVVPPGWYGFISAAGVGIIRRAMVEQELGLQALEKLGSADPESRSPDFEGRRLVRVDGGYIVLNFIKYREKDATAADRSRRWRERQKERSVNGVSDTSQRVSKSPSRVIRHQAEAEAEAEADITSTSSVERMRASAPRAPKKEKEDGKFKLAAGWQPDEHCRAYAQDRGLDPADTTDVFVDYFTCRKGKSERRDGPGWSKRWQAWCRADVTRPLANRPARTPQSPRGNDAFFDELATIRNRSSAAAEPVGRDGAVDEADSALPNEARHAPR